jgi:hypothetical protein
MLIMKDTLKQMGIDYTELNENQIDVKTNYRATNIDALTGQISYDSSDENIVNQIKQGYTVNFYKDQAIREGMQIHEERQANGEVHLFFN